MCFCRSLKLPRTDDVQRVSAVFRLVKIRYIKSRFAGFSDHALICRCLPSFLAIRLGADQVLLSFFDLIECEASFVCRVGCFCFSISSILYCSIRSVKSNKAAAITDVPISSFLRYFPDQLFYLCVHCTSPDCASVLNVLLGFFSVTPHSVQSPPV